MVGIHQTVDLETIDLKDCYRKVLGDIQRLGLHIEKNGLLNPVIMRGDGKLISGSRRVAAMLRRGIKTAEAVYAVTFDQVIELLRAEGDTLRLPTKISEGSERGLLIEEMMRLGGGRSKSRISHSEYCDIGSVVGLSGSGYNRAKAVVKAARLEPEVFCQMVADMNKHGTIHFQYEKMRSALRERNSLPCEPIEPVNGSKSVGVIRANEAIDCLLRIPANDHHRQRAYEIVSGWIRHNKKKGK